MQKLTSERERLAYYVEDPWKSYIKLFLDGNWVKK